MDTELPLAYQVTGDVPLFPFPTAKIAVVSDDDVKDADVIAPTAPASEPLGAADGKLETCLGEQFGIRVQLAENSRGDAGNSREDSLNSQAAEPCLRRQRIVGKDDCDMIGLVTKVEDVGMNISTLTEICGSLVADEPGLYKLLLPALVTASIEKPMYDDDPDILMRLDAGTVVDVAMVVERQDQKRLRAQLTQPVAGWISLENLEDGKRWAEKVARSPAGAEQVGARASHAG